MNKIQWCLRQKNGVQLVEPNEVLSAAYFADADDSLLAMGRNEGKWKIVTSYYSCYNALYALLMKAGIKSEIYDCTLALMHLFSFSVEEITFLENLKKDRVDAQHYLQIVSAPPTQKVTFFVARCRAIAASLDKNTILGVRGLVKNG